MANPFLRIPADFESWQDDVYESFYQPSHDPSDEASYYSQANSTLDGLDEGTSLTSELDEPPLTLGSTLASSHRLASCPSWGQPPEDTGRYHHDGLNAAQLKESCDDLSAPQLDLQCIGGNPEIYRQDQVARLLDLSQDVDLSINLSPLSTPDYYGAPSGSRLAASNRPQTRLSPPHTPTYLVPPPGVSSSASGGEPMKKGRSKGLEEPQRAKVAGMRATRACQRCHIRKVECHPGLPCPECIKDFLGHPEVCDRAKLVELLPEGGETSIWLTGHDGDPTPGSTRQPTGGPRQVVVTFDPAPVGPPGLTLIVQPFVESVMIDWLSQAGWGHSYPPSSTTFGIAPNAANGYWPGTWAAGQPHAPGPPIYFSQNGIQHCLVPQAVPLTHQLLNWAEAQVSRESAREISFEAAIQAFVFALRDGLLSRSRARSRALALSSNNRTGGARQGRPSSNSVPKPLLALLHNVCEMACWFRIWQAPGLHVSGVAAVRRGGGGLEGVMGPQPELLSTTALSELKRLALRSLVQCERLVLSDLDAFGPSIKGMEVSVWACLLQMIFIYRQVIATYSPWLQNHSPGPSVQVLAALATVQRLHRVLLVKYSAYFGSSSPLHPWSGKPSTAQSLDGDERLRTTWFTVLSRHGGFFRDISASAAPEDEMFKVLVVDVEQNMERKRRKGHK